jgi:hypothetical protein
VKTLANSVCYPVFKPRLDRSCAERPISPAGAALCTGNDPGEGKPASNFLLARTNDNKRANVFNTNTLVPLPAEDALSTVQNMPCALRLEYKEVEDAVSVVAFLEYSCPGSQEDTENGKHPRERLASYSLRLGQSVVLGEMRRFGVQPYTIQLVSATVAPSSVPTISKVPSLALQVTGEDRGFHIVKIDNLSPVAVMGLVLSRSSGKERTGLDVYDNSDPVIAPRASHYFPLKNNPLSCPSANTGASNLEPVVCPVVLVAAVFADGSHGGDPEIAARLEAARITLAGPHRELEELVKKVAEDPTLSDEQKIVRLRQEIEKLPGDSGRVALDQFRSRYSELSEEQWGRVKTSLSKRVQMDRERLLNHLAKDGPTGDATKVQSRSEWMLHW